MPYRTIVSQITRYRNKQLFLDIKTFDEVPNESEYYITIRNENFMIFKDSNMIIFQSPFQAKLFMYYKNIFADGTFYIAPTNSYQVFITRTYVRIDNINFIDYKNMEAELKNIGCGKNDIIENWFNCLVRLNNKITDFNKTK
ncbi:hypothetical protein PIROE2DRAFT_1457 [Piromyces sp. E2]|nr:hypothetical protein PIROE2DRAFT_1457 [Piromyces sp. E2]|eukprot:OUM70325.1 hypothetical protein PIROE2DRAFT_1457 [Piromyces sp. E2]